MGLLDFLTGLLGSQESSSSSSGSEQSMSSEIVVDLPAIEYQGNRFFSEYSDSESGEWRVAYGKSMRGDVREHCLFLLRNGELQFTKKLVRIEDAKVSETGRVLRRTVPVLPPEQSRGHGALRRQHRRRTREADG